ncbi:hypothetical protein M2369_001505 [Bacillus sp. JUb11]|nr:hypothetical protein [Bacillus sp. JUb11]PYH27991.1 hypothetical protein US8_00614 [Bacillus altitudinis]
MNELTDKESLFFISIVTEFAEEYDTDVQTCIKDLQALSKQLIEKEVVYVK